MAQFFIFMSHSNFFMFVVQLCVPVLCPFRQVIIPPPHSSLILSPFFLPFVSLFFPPFHTQPHIVSEHTCSFTSTYLHKCRAAFQPSVVPRCRQVLPRQTVHPPTLTHTQPIRATKAGGYRKYRTLKPPPTQASCPAPSQHPHLHTWAPGVLISWRTPSTTRLRKARESGTLADRCGHL